MTAPITRLQDKVALVTGAARGMGRAIAIRLAGEGARVVIGDIQAELAERTAAEIVASGAEARALKLDVTSLDEALAVTDRIERELGPLDILVNNAGWDKSELFVDSHPDTWDKVIAINYRGVLNCCRAVAPRMQARGRGKIVSMSSDAGRVGSSTEAVYAGCKAAIIAFSKTLARELARYHINVNVVCAGPTDTALLREAFAGREKVIEALARAIPFRRLGTPEDVVGAIAFFASSDADFVTGQVLSVSGGLTMVG
ncbi:MAG TPA: 3-oxoacyl-ACP reductase family protein [Candidatus Binataceae bacterium]|nr:3-oxoacyl-ACP reductase family protein [Candidatus Binataceae bacterium]